jgi:GTP-binding protein YchF
MDDMKVGIIGLPSVGKTTVLNAISGASAEIHSYSGKADAEANFAVVSVPDTRQDWLAQHYKPKKNTHATVELVDVAGMNPGAASKDDLSPQLLTNLRQVDALVHVIRVFDDPSVPHPSGSIDALRDAETLELELILADMSVVEKRLSKIDAEIGRKKGTEKSKLEEEKELLTRFSELLQSEKPLRGVELTADEDKMIRGYTFLSQKPLMIVGNISESEIGDAGAKHLSKAAAWAAERNMPMIAFCGKAEMEIAQLDEAERGEFMEALGIEESSRDKLIRAVYELLRLLAFFTVGEDEVRAWTITRDTNAQEAAGKIHSDIARGFIRAEVCSYDALHNNGSWNAAKDKGQVRLEGKEYKVQDGDCINFRFAV